MMIRILFILKSPSRWVFLKLYMKQWKKSLAGKMMMKIFSLLMIKGGWDSDYWGVMVTKIPSAMKKFKGNIKNAKSKKKKVYF